MNWFNILHGILLFLMCSSLVWFIIISYQYYKEIKQLRNIEQIINSMLEILRSK